jgi:hypothetical protein
MMSDDVHDRYHPLPPTIFTYILFPTIIFESLYWLIRVGEGRRRTTTRMATMTTTKYLVISTA